MTSQWITDLENFFTHFSQANFDALVADIQQGIQVAESDLARAAAYIVANGPTFVADAQSVISVLGALTGQLTIPTGVISALEVAVTDINQFIGAVGKVSSVTTAGFMSTLAALPDSNEAPGTLVSGYKMHQALIAATAAGRLALGTATRH
jgi:hypothetical protein